MFTKLLDKLYLGDEEDAKRLRPAMTHNDKPYIFVDARPFFNLLSGDADAGELMICPLRALSASLAMLIANGVAVYLYCQAGVERSPFTAALTLHQLGGEPRMTLMECYREVAEKHPQTLVYPQWVEAMEGT